MEEEDLIKEAEQALSEIENKKHKHHRAEKVKPHEARHNPFAYLLVLILLLLIIMMAVPYYGIKLDPEPENIPSVKSVAPDDLGFWMNATPGIPAGSRTDMVGLVVSDNPIMRNMAVKIATESCEDNRICYAKAAFFFVRDEFEYVADPPNDYLESPFETIYSGGADCDGMAIILANLMTSIGVPTRFAFIPNHVYVQIKLDEAPKKYKEDDGWISLDPTCDACEFGEVPYSTQNKRKEFLYI